MTRRQVAVAIGIAMAASIDCSAPSGSVQPSTPTSEIVLYVQIPPPESRSPQATVEGEATWLTDRPGCTSLVTEAGQRFSCPAASCWTTSTGPAWVSSHGHNGCTRPGTCLNAASRPVISAPHSSRKR